MELCHVLPLIESRPSHLDRTNDTFFEVLRVLLHDDDRLLKSVLLVNLLLKLTSYERVGVPFRVKKRDQYRTSRKRGNLSKLTKDLPLRELP